mmetsp:Transcript_97745/g.219115  ORF Transcript_97745/g.219115 Transcript_97745/m.219115 type:complete len:239 (+) Transcript_97745:397-1113(+)
MTWSRRRSNNTLKGMFRTPVVRLLLSAMKTVRSTSAVMWPKSVMMRSKARSCRKHLCSVSFSCICKAASSAPAWPPRCCCCCGLPRAVDTRFSGVCALGRGVASWARRALQPPCPTLTLISLPSVTMSPSSWSAWKKLPSNLFTSSFVMRVCAFFSWVRSWAISSFSCSVWRIFWRWFTWPMSSAFSLVTRLISPSKTAKRSCKQSRSSSRSLISCWNCFSVSKRLLLWRRSSSLSLP